MLKFKPRNYCPILVLISGLLSCAPEKKDVDVFVASAPRLIRADRTVELKDWDRSVHRELDLHDVVDVRGSGVARIEVTSRCRKGDHDRLELFSYPVADGRLPVFQLVPEELLAIDLESSAVTCAFEIHLVNGAGSRHVFNLLPARLHSTRQTSAALARGSEMLIGLDLFLQTRDWSGVKLRSDSTPNSQAAIVCERVKSEVLPFFSAQDISNFDPHKFHPHPDQPEHALEAYPDQHCRALIMVNQRIEKISPLFRIYFAGPPLEVATLNLPQRSDAQVLFNKTRAAQHKTGDYQIRNSNRGPRWIRISKRQLRVQFVGWPAGMVAQNFLSVHLERGKGVNIEERGDHWLVTIAPSSALSLSTYVYTRRPGACHWPDLVFVDLPEPFQFEEISESGFSVGRQSLDLGPRFTLLNTFPRASDKQMSFAGRPGAICGVD